jgi:putative transposase
LRIGNWAVSNSALIVARVERPRLRSFEGKEQALPSWEAAVAEDWLGKWAMNQMLINVSTRKFARSVRLPEGDVPAPMGSGLSKSAASRRFVALSAARMKEWVASDLSGLDLLVIQIDGIHMDEDPILVAAIGVDAKGDKHPLGLIEGATENAATVQALINNLIERGLDPAVPRLFISDGAKALSKAIRRTFGAAAAIQLSGPQGSQHYGAITQIAVRFGPACVATSMGT